MDASQHGGSARGCSFVGLFKEERGIALVHDDVAAVAVPGSNAVHVYRRDGNVWRQEAELTVEGTVALGEGNNQFANSGTVEGGVTGGSNADNVQNQGEMIQTAGTDTIRTTFVLLKLLESDADSFAKLLLAKAKQGSAETESRPNMNVDWMGPFTATRDRVRSCGLGLFRFHLLPLSTCPAIKV